MNLDRTLVLHCSRISTVPVALLLCFSTRAPPNTEKCRPSRPSARRRCVVMGTDYQTLEPVADAASFFPRFSIFPKLSFTLLATLCWTLENIIWLELGATPLSQLFATPHLILEHRLSSNRLLPQWPTSPPAAARSALTAPPSRSSSRECPAGPEDGIGQPTTDRGSVERRKCQRGKLDALCVCGAAC